MNNLCADIGWKSINHEGEQLCGDHIDIVDQDENSSVIVLADGLGSGVKASILSTLTSKIISTMLAEGIKLEECVSTIAATLPICSVRGVAYSTFTIIHLIDNQTVELIQYDNPEVIFIRDAQVYDYEKHELNICGKNVLKSVIRLKEGDIMIELKDTTAYTVIEASEILQLSQFTVGKYIREGRIKAQKVGRKYYVTDKTIKEFLNGDAKNDSKDDA